MTNSGRVTSKATSRSDVLRCGRAVRHGLSGKFTSGSGYDLRRKRRG
jgi:hypothetical protein